MVDGGKGPGPPQDAEQAGAGGRLGELYQRARAGAARNGTAAAPPGRWGEAAAALLAEAGASWDGSARDRLSAVPPRPAPACLLPPCPPLPSALCCMSPRPAAPSRAGLAIPPPPHAASFTPY